MEFAQVCVERGERSCRSGPQVPLTARPRSRQAPRRCRWADARPGTRRRARRRAHLNYPSNPVAACAPEGVSRRRCGGRCRCVGDARLRAWRSRSTAASRRASRSTARASRLRAFSMSKSYAAGWLAAWFATLPRRRENRDLQNHQFAGIFMAVQEAGTRRSRGRRTRRGTTGALERDDRRRGARSRSAQRGHVLRVVPAAGRADRGAISRSAASRSRRARASASKAAAGRGCR
jgi:hypothetical protein